MYKICLSFEFINLFRYSQLVSELDLQIQKNICSSMICKLMHIYLVTDYVCICIECLTLYLYTCIPAVVTHTHGYTKYIQFVGSQLCHNLLDLVIYS